jgi:pectinesterase
MIRHNRLICLLGFTLLSVETVAYDLVVDSGYSGTPGQLAAETRTFVTINEALAQVQPDNPSVVEIFIREGRYEEKLVVDKPNIHFRGESREGTVITHDDHGDSIDAEGNKLGTTGSYTLRVTAAGFRAESLTIRNHFDYAANALLNDDDPAKVTSTQGVALMLDEGSDRAMFNNVIIDGNQDTLFVDAGRSYFLNARIAGHVDFIFGAGQAVFDRCEIISRNRANKNPTGYITAPSTKKDMPFGFLFLDCKLVKETTGLPTGSVRLGRPWHPGADPGVNGSAVFMNCFMDDHIGPQGYAPISSRNAASERIWFEVGPESRFFEHNSHGPGGSPSPSRPRLSPQAAPWYTADNVLNGGVPEW